MKFTRLVLLLTLFVFAGSVSGQSVRWRPKKRVVKKVELFHSTQSINSFTSTMLRKGEFEYEISHRFIPPISTENAMFGIDGPARMRMALAYGFSNRGMMVLGRSNFQDNVDLQIRYRLWQKANKLFPMALAMRAGAAWSTDVAGRTLTDTRNFQYYAQLVFNGLFRKKLGVGVVPSYVYNSHVLCPQVQYSFTIDAYVQYYLTSLLSLLVETNTTVSGYRGKYNSFALGIELETGGHFFKIFVTNNAALNPSQYLAGSDLPLQLKNLRLGFNITRILKF